MNALRMDYCDIAEMLMREGAGFASSDAHTRATKTFLKAEQSLLLSKAPSLRRLRLLQLIELCP